MPENNLPIGRLFDAIKKKYKLDTDRELAEHLEVHSPVIASTRAGSLKVGANMILRIHEKCDIPVKTIRRDLGKVL